MPLAIAVTHVPAPERALVVECEEGDEVCAGRRWPGPRITIGPWDRRLFRHGLEAVELGESEGIPFRVGRLRA